MNRLSKFLSLGIGTAALLTAAVGCSSGASPGPTGSGSGSPEALTATQVTVNDPQSNNPSLSFPVPSSAVTLTTKDLATGSGTAATPADTVKVNYLGVGATTGTEFDSSFKRGQPIEFPLQQVIPGWTQGLTGMKPGGERVLVIPGQLAYGANPPSGAGIKPNETLVFYVKLIEVSTRPAP